MIYTYTRVSTLKQVDEGESLDIQHRVTTGYCLMNGWTIDRAFVERGVSGSVPLGERPEGAKLIALATKGDIIVSAKLDRMFRSSQDALRVLGNFKGAGASLHLIDLGGDVVANGIGKLVFTILSAVAEAERDRIRERIQGAKSHAKSRGAYLGGKVPYGYTVAGGMLQPDADQQAMCERIRVRRAAGETLRAIKSGLKLNLSLDAISRVCAPTDP